ncbi:p94 [Alphabaculovirus alterspexiguae]|uniref:p94 n=1 Tax=Spodoptera exigua multiple nucleopolyhedrovirus TaxID=10454 RepID=A0A3G2JU23_9ABAC|nr:p94 [Spodoptera exigua multiple nucleopolyhedrovirus]AYN45047.1 p94 [Spodoptera exigua multiple nucleopolyhedrovirus]
MSEILSVTYYKLTEIVTYYKLTEIVTMFKYIIHVLCNFFLHFFKRVSDNKDHKSDNKDHKSDNEYDTSDDEYYNNYKYKNYLYDLLKCKQPKYFEIYKSKRENEINIKDYSGVYRAPYVSYYEDYVFDYKTQLPIDDNLKSTKKFDFDTLKVKDLYQNKREIVSFLKSKYSNVGDQSQLEEVIEKLVNMRNRMLKGKEPIKEYAFQKEIMTNTTKFVNLFKKTEFYRARNFGCVSHLYEDLNVYIDILIEFIRSDDKKVFDFNERYANYYCNKPLASIDTIEDFPVIEKDSIYNYYDESDTDTFFLHFHHDININTQFDSDDDRYAEALEFPFFFNIVIFARLFEPITILNKKINHYSKETVTVLLLSPKYDKYNDYVIYKRFFNNQKVPLNMGIFYYILYKKIIINDSKEDIFVGLSRYDQETQYKICQAFKNYVVHRLMTTNCTLSLTKNDFFPQFQVPLVNALLYSCYVSTRIFKEHPVYFYQERLKQLYRYVDDLLMMLELCDLKLELCNYRMCRVVNNKKFKICKKYIKNRVSSIKAYEDSHVYLKRIIELSYEKSSKGNYTIAKLKPVAPIKYLKKIFNFDVNLNDIFYCYYKFGDMLPGKEVINQHTMRPCVMESSDENVSYYEKLHKNVLEITINDDGSLLFSKLGNKKVDFKKVVSLYKLFQHFVFLNNNYPEFYEYNEYVMKRLIKEKKFCLFDENIELCIKKVYKNYIKFLIKYDLIYPATFINACNRSKTIQDRLAIEGHSDKIDNVTKYICMFYCK